ncbi:hypothetical protein EGK14_20465 [Erwinia sp. 198]|nr:hypothetical protein EGK14_20465 [Erwinia sp. 198]
MLLIFRMQTVGLTVRHIRKFFHHFKPQRVPELRWLTELVRHVRRISFDDIGLPEVVFQPFAGQVKPVRKDIITRCRLNPLVDTFQRSDEARQNILRVMISVVLNHSLP